MYLEGSDYRTKLYDRTEDLWHAVILGDPNFRNDGERDSWTYVILSALGMMTVADGEKAVERGADLLVQLVDLLAFASAKSGHAQSAARLIGFSRAVGRRLNASHTRICSDAEELARRKLGDKDFDTQIAAGARMLDDPPPA